MAFCSPDEMGELKDIQKVMKISIPVASGRAWEVLPDAGAKPKGRGTGPRRGGKPQGNNAGGAGAPAGRSRRRRRSGGGGGGGARAQAA